MPTERENYYKSYAQAEKTEICYTKGMTLDRFKYIRGFNHGYSIDINGIVFSHKTNKVLKSYCHGGYLRIGLYKKIGNRSYNKFIHRLVAKCFIPAVKGKNIINHKDGNKLNNKIENLEWCTQQENYDHAIKLGLMKKPQKGFYGGGFGLGESHINSKLTEKEVKEIRKRYIHRVWGKGQRFLAKEYGVSNCVISKLVNRLTWKSVV